MVTMADESEIVPELTDVQRKRIAANRERALQIKKAKLAVKSIAENNTAGRRAVDTGGGFLLDQETMAAASQGSPVKTVQMPSEHSTCDSCGKAFLLSFLLENFALEVCDNCRDKEDKHKLITRTESKAEYLLKDCDFDRREPPLKFIVKKNPHYSLGSMKLYLKCQVEERAIEVWGSLEELDRELEKKDGERAKRKQKAFNKRVKELRMTVRSSLYRPPGTNHVHSYGDEEHDADNDEYFKICDSCGHRMSYEKM